MILGIGLDIIETARVEKALQNPVFLKKVYTEGEQEYLAKRKAMLNQPPEYLLPRKPYPRHWEPALAP